jgi:gliding motility-associated lipoprotein GldH
MDKLFKIFILTGFSYLFTGCEKGVVYSEFVSFEGDVWEENNPAEFIVAVQDSTALFDMELYINTYKEYPYRNMYLFLETLYPSGKMSRDTLEFLFQTETGRYMGKCNNTSCRNEFLFKQNLKFNQTGPHVFRFIQAMRSTDGKLPYVRQFGLKIKKAQSSTSGR